MSIVGDVTPTFLVGVMSRGFQEFDDTYTSCRRLFCLRAEVVGLVLASVTRHIDRGEWVSIGFRTPPPPFAQSSRTRTKARILVARG